MALPIRAGTANTLNLGPALNIGTGLAMTSLVLAPSALFLSKNGSIFAVKADANTAYHDRAGWYKVPVDTADTGVGGRLIIQASPTSCLELWQEYEVMPAAYYDALYAGSASLRVIAEAASMAGFSYQALANSVWTAPNRFVMSTSIAGFSVQAIANSVWAAATRALTDKAGFTLDAAYDPAKTAAQAGNEMDLVDAPNVAAIAAIQANLALQASLIAASNSVWNAPTRALTDKAGFTLHTDYDPAKTAAQAGDAMTLTAAYDAAKTAATQLSVNQIPNSVWNNPTREVVATAASMAGFSYQAIANSVWTHILTGTLEAQMIMRGLIAVMAGKTSGGLSDTFTFRNVADDKDVVVATMNTATGDRTAVVLDLT